ncbi:energy transducer TonB [Bdellovibrio svalbardensis]|uniref:Energy transducer TonB n=1 Tax=Bdellovibrio svalbardensis TaxID=2972972 RepID=A0ABT6DJ06_9BACT|nr:energy transducer TonB [Bdellovibrio svalbardensis]MDG0815058.1 energy transducer TonB [Bdellovibrio svalbardensis]
MGFDLKSGEENHENQLSLFEMPSMNFSEEKQANQQAINTPKASADHPINQGSSAMDYHTWRMAHTEPEQSKTSRYMTMSMAIHAAAILAIAMMSVPLVEEVKTETITIELEDTPAPRLQARGAKVTPTQGGTPVIAESKPTPSTPAPAPAAAAKDVGGPGDVIVASKHAKATKMAKATKANKAASPKAQIAGAKAARSIAPKTNFKAVPMTIDDIEAPELDQGDFAKANVRSDLNEDFNEDFANIDRSHKQALASEKSKMDAMASALAAEQDDELKSIDDQNKEDAARFAALQQSMRKNNAKAIASAIASERANAAALAAHEAAARENAARAAAAANARKAGLGGGGNGRGQEQGAGAGNNGSNAAGTQVAGSPTGVRSLDQLRQMPGNPRPQYDREERRRGDAGQLTYVAYVTKEGYVTRFQLRKSTGFQNLDMKTLNALKKWRFYPGQEGWVELPFRWDLKGGMQEDGGRLRTAVSQR